LKGEHTLNLCNNCGAVLPDDEQDVCPVCGAEQRTGSQKNEKVIKNKTSKAPKVLLIIAAVLAVLLAAACIATTVLYNKYNLNDAYDAIGKALLDNDIKTLQKYVVGDGVEVTGDNLQVLCNAFAAESDVKTLVTQLKQQAAGETSSVRYSALTAVNEKVFLGYSAYKMQAKAVSMRVPADVTNPLLTVNGASHTGEVQADGVVYGGLFPGLYSCVLTAESGTGSRITGTETPLSLLDSAAPTVFNGALPIATITVSECISDDAVISVDGKQLEQHPSGHVVTIEKVPVGATISMQYLTAYGATTTANVQFTDINQTQLAFANHVTEGGIPEEAQLNSLLGAYYASYLDCINNQDITKLLSSTPLNAERLTPDMSTADHKANLYVFTSAACQYGSVGQGEFETKPSITCNVEFKFTYSNRETKAEAEGTLRQTCELVFNYEAAAWQVNRVSACPDEAWAAGDAGDC
jgi:hypothetical protein